MYVRKKTENQPATKTHRTVYSFYLLRSTSVQCGPLLADQRSTTGQGKF